MKNAELLIAFLNHLTATFPGAVAKFEPETAEITVYEFLAENSDDPEIKETALQLRAKKTAKENEAENKTLEKQEEQRKWDLSRRRLLVQ